jgi:hypothetical protein
MNKNIDLQRISKDMKPGIWYDIKDEEHIRQFKQLCDSRFGWPVFQLSFNNDMNKIKKTII